MAFATRPSPMDGSGMGSSQTTAPCGQSSSATGTRIKGLGLETWLEFRSPMSNILLHFYIFTSCTFSRTKHHSRAF